MNLVDVLQLKYPSAIFGTDIIVKTDLNGDLAIVAWNLEGTSEPTLEDINVWKIQYDLAYRQKLAVQARVYPSIGNQLDMQYKDLLNNTTTWVDAISAIKAAHPKPNE